MDPARHEILEVALVVFDRDGVQERFSSLVRPRARLSLDIARLTGLDDKELAAAPRFGEIAPELRRLLAGRPIVGHSAGMDVAMLEAAGLTLPNPVYDTFHLSTLLLPDLPAHSLPLVAVRLGIEPGERHRAAEDAELSARVFRAFLAELETHDAATLEQVAALARQAGWPVADLFGAIALRRPAAPILSRFGEENGRVRRGPHELAFLVPRDKPEPLRPTGSNRPIDLDAVRTKLRPGGALSRVVSHFEHRPQQEAMAVAVGRALAQEGQLLVEAGTGTGKSIAYLLPAALHARERGERVVVSTNTLALQDQLYRKDIPDLQRALADDGEPPVRASVLKGRTNYLCLRRWFNQNRQPAADPAEAGLRAKVVLWLGETETGDRAELRMTADEELRWRHLSAEEDACVPGRCVYNQRNQCFLFRARREAEHAHLVVVNHALLLSDTIAGSRVLPDYERLVIDEAHHLEDQATNQFGTTLDERILTTYLDDLIRVDGSLTAGTIPTAVGFLARRAGSGANDTDKRRASAATDRGKLALDRAEGARAATRDLFLRLREIAVAYSEDGGGYDRTVRVTPSLRRSADWAEVEAVWDGLDQHLRGLEEQVRWFRDVLEQLDLPNLDELVPGSPEEAAALQQDELAVTLQAALRQGGDLAALLQTGISTPDPGAVYWIERSAIQERISLHAAPIQVSGLLNEELFAPLRSLVLTSATITTDGSFDFVAGRLGLDESDQLAVQSPFDYRRSTLLYLVDDIPEPNQPGYQRRLQETLIELCDATQGRALVLFTSHAALQATYRAIKGPLEDAGVLVLAQRTDGSPRQLIERLKTTPNVVLLGTATFWEGVDVVGPALSLLVITKLPFAVPTDPVFAARSDLFEAPFLDYAVPQAVLKFKQGFGRLIRSSRDRGVCAVLDRRVISKRYGASFVQSLPECSETIGSTADLPLAAADWLSEGR
jgi:DNA polymerase-3 subunit epsilon/ATP-dependent DNA helicase DinG